MNYCKTYIEDLKEVTKNIKDIQNLNNRKILITGGLGMIGSSIADVLFTYNKENDANVDVYIASRNEDNSNSRFSGFDTNDKYHFIKYDVCKPLESDIKFDYIIHCASVSNPQAYVKQPVETMMSNILGLNNLVNYGRENGLKRLLYVSSSEVYGKNQENEPYKEGDYGFVDILDVRSSYPSSKRATETLCISYANEYDIESVIVRPGHIYGPTMSQNDMRVASHFAREASKGNDLIMKSEGTQLRSYCYVLDCASAILTVLINGENCNAYNISNKNSIVSIREMANSFAKAGNVKVKIENPSNEERKAFNKMDNSSLNSEKIEKLGWVPLFDMDTGAKHTVDSLLANTNTL